MPTVKLVYFDAQSRGQLTRLLLNAGNLDFEDFRISFADWPKHKPGTPFGSTPVLYWDGEELGQSMAIARFVARKVGLAGKCDLEMAQADMVVCHMEDIWLHLPALRFAKTQEEREVKAETFLNDFLPKWLEPMETLLRKRGGVWFAGNGVTFADLGLMVLLDLMHEPEEIAFKDLDNLAARAKILDSFPLVKAKLHEGRSALPSVMAWKKKRPAFSGL